MTKTESISSNCPESLGRSLWRREQDQLTNGVCVGGGIMRWIATSAESLRFGLAPCRINRAGFSTHVVPLIGSVYDATVDRAHPFHLAERDGDRKRTTLLLELH